MQCNGNTDQRILSFHPHADYQPKYDSLEGAAGWAQESLRLHAADPRQFVYTRQQLEEAK